MSADTPASPQPWRAKADATLSLQRCANCGAFQYPPRELCGHCLGDALPWTEDRRLGALLGISMLHKSFDARLRKYLPMRIGAVQLDCGPVVICYLDDECRRIGQQVRVVPNEDELQQRVLVAVPEPAPAVRD